MNGWPDCKANRPHIVCLKCGPSEVVKSSSLYTTVTHDGLRSLASEHAGKFDIWAHHVVLDTEVLDTLVPGNVKIALFRNPSDRVLSSFRHGASISGPQIATDIVHALQQNKWPVELCNDADRLFNEASHSQFCCGPAAGMAMSGFVGAFQNYSLLRYFDLPICNKFDFILRKFADTATDL